jgi:hypothetical protein
MRHTQPHSAVIHGRRGLTYILLDKAEERNFDKFCRQIRLGVTAFLQLQPVNPSTLSAPNQILRIIKHLPKRKASGHDSIRNTDLRNLPLDAVTHLTKIINAAFCFHCFPKTWKEANVISIPKPKKNPAFSQDRRPVSYIPCAKSKGKIQTIMHLTRTRYDATTTALLLIKFSEHARTAAMSLDVSKACDTIWATGLNQSPSYLPDRKFIVTMGGKSSEWKPVLAGVPQGSVLAPSVCVADIPRRPETGLKLFWQEVPRWAYISKGA